MEIKRNPTIHFNVLFGKVELHSPYLWKEGESYKPLIEEMGITHNGKSEAVLRALSDFGSEESFGQAAKRFKEHYKYEVGSSAVNRATKEVAQEAMEYVEARLSEGGKSYREVVGVRGKAEKMLVELDGCDIRTAAISVIEHTTDTSPVRELPKKSKKIEWREVRIGFARPLEAVTKTYIGKMDGYPEVVGQLFDAAVVEGMTPTTKVVGVADGGNGLKEELESQFENLQFILDKTHLKDHFYATAEELGIKEKDRPGWVKPRLEAISSGEIERVYEELRAMNATVGNHRLKRLLGYLDRFYDSIDYAEYKKKGYPLGSGEVESAHKSIPQKRLKIPGACWKVDSINPMVALRIVKANEWWEDFWSKRTDHILAVAA